MMSHWELQGSSWPGKARTAQEARTPCAVLVVGRLVGRLPANRATLTVAEAATRPEATTATPADALRLRIRHVDLQLATLEGLTVQLRDRRLGLSLRGHLHEAEPPRTARESIGDHRGGHDRAALGEIIPKALGGCGIGQTTDVQLGRHDW